MIDDKNILTASGTALTATASSDVFDTDGPGDIGISCNPLWIYAVVQTPLTSSGSTTLTVTFETSTDNSTFTTVMSTAAIPKATLVAGYNILNMPLPVGCNRYVRLTYTVASGPFTGGTVFAAIMPSGTRLDRYYPDNIPA